MSTIPSEPDPSTSPLGAPASPATQGSSNVSHVGPSAAPPLPQDPAVPLPNGASPFGALPGEMVRAILKLTDPAAFPALRLTSKPLFVTLREPVTDTERGRAASMLLRLPPHDADETASDWGVLAAGLRRLWSPSSGAAATPPAWITEAFGRWAAKIARLGTVAPQQAVETAGRLRDYLQPDLAAERLVALAAEARPPCDICAVLVDVLASARGRRPPVSAHALVKANQPVGASFVPRLEQFVADMQAQPALDRALSLLLLCQLVPAAAHPQPGEEEPGVWQQAQSVAPALFGAPPPPPMNPTVHRLMKHVCDQVERLPPDLKLRLSGEMLRTLSHLGRYEGGRQAWEARVNEVLRP